MAPAPGTAIPKRGEISRRLWKFNTRAAACNIPAVHRLAKQSRPVATIEAAITTGCSNARSEGFSRLANIKDATPSASETPPTRPAAYAGPAPAASITEQPAQV